MKTFHKGIMTNEIIENMNIRDAGIYVDATLGGGDHTKALLESNKTIKVYAFDRDQNAIDFAKEDLQKYLDRLTILKSNFRDLRTCLALNKVSKIDGIIFDLGVSSHQIDNSARGFSFEQDGKLDMRMDREEKNTAADIINKYSYEELRDIFYSYGQERESNKIAGAVIRARQIKPIVTTAELSKLIDESTNSPKKIKAKARIFQALRIYVNREFESIQQAILDSVKILNQHGRIAVISYHSLEDRLIKHFFIEETKDCVCPPGFPKCICDKKSRLEIITKKPITPSEQEIEANPRARSAKLRIAERKEVL
jgi:16S rRNA (cytosine1402-N4)-methyltransferase